MRLKIISDGTPYGTHVEDAETGEKLEHVLAVHWSHAKGGELPIAHLTLLHVTVEVVAQAETAEEPYGPA